MFTFHLPINTVIGVMLPNELAAAWTWPAASPASKVYVHQPEEH